MDRIIIEIAETVIKENKGELLKLGKDIACLGAAGAAGMAIRDLTKKAYEKNIGKGRNKYENKYTKVLKIAGAIGVIGAAGVAAYQIGQVARVGNKDVIEGITALKKNAQYTANELRELSELSELSEIEGEYL